MSDMSSNTIIRKIASSNFATAVDFFLQPIFDLSTFKCVGAEALMRGLHRHSVVSPADFLHQLEGSDDMTPLGNYIIRQALLFLQKEILPRKPDFFMSINLSIQQINDEGFRDMLRDLFLTTGVPVSQVIFEITGPAETITPVGQENIRQLREGGYAFAWDDVATVADVAQKMAVSASDYIKLDRSCLKKGNSEPTHDVINAIQQHDAVIIAEGVETMAQTSMLLKHNVVRAQGFLFSRPMRKTDFTRTYL